MSGPGARHLRGSRAGAVLRLLAAALLAGCLLASAAGTPTVAAADPTATPGEAGDPRSSGEGPGFAGEPLLAIGAVMGIGVASVLLTLAYVRATDRRRP